MWYRCHCVVVVFLFFFFNDTATTEIYTLSLHDALPILLRLRWPGRRHDEGVVLRGPGSDDHLVDLHPRRDGGAARRRSEEHTSELQSRQYLVCRLLLEKKKKLVLQLFLRLDLSHLQAFG